MTVTGSGPAPRRRPADPDARWVSGLVLRPAGARAPGPGPGIMIQAQAEKGSLRRPSRADSESGSEHGAAAAFGHQHAAPSDARFKLSTHRRAPTPRQPGWCAHGFTCTRAPGRAYWETLGILRVPSPGPEANLKEGGLDQTGAPPPGPGTVTTALPALHAQSRAYRPCARRRCCDVDVHCSARRNCRSAHGPLARQAALSSQRD